MLERLRNLRVFGMTPGDWVLYLMLLIAYGISLLFNALPYILPALQISTWLLRILLAIPIAIMGIVYRYEIRENRKDIESELAKLRDSMAKLAIENILELAVQGLRAHQGRESYRANIMLIENNKLAIRFHYGMADAPDRNIQFERNQGCAGQTWGSGKQMCADLQTAEAVGGPRWNLSADQKAITGHLGAVLSTPIFDPRKRLAIMGIFNIDSGLSLQKAGFLDEEISNQAEGYAEMFGAWLQYLVAPAEGGRKWQRWP